MSVVERIAEYTEAKAILLTEEDMKRLEAAGLELLKAGSPHASFVLSKCLLWRVLPWSR